MPKVYARPNVTKYQDDMFYMSRHIFIHQFFLCAPTLDKKIFFIKTLKNSYELVWNNDRFDINVRELDINKKA